MYCCWNATHIVLVATKPQGDIFEVIESWKGNLRVGEDIAVRELKPAPDAIPIAVHFALDAKQWPYCTLSRDPHIGDVPEQATGSLVVLFLKRASEDSAESEAKTGVTQQKWQSADPFREMRTSAICVDGGELYEFVQWVNPGPSSLSPLGMSLGEVNSRVRELIHVQQALTDAATVEDRRARAERLKPFVRSDVFLVTQSALEELRKCASAALETIRGMLDDPAFSGEVEELTKMYSEAVGEGAGEELDRRLQQELSFWRAAGPVLARGWWNKDARPRADAVFPSARHGDPTSRSLAVASPIERPGWR